MKAKADIRFVGLVVLMETDEQWLTGKRYLNMNTGVNN